MSRNNPNVLIIFDHPEQLKDRFAKRFPQAAFHYATNADEVLSLLADANPEVVFSIKHQDFPGDQHRPAKDHASVQWVQVGGSGYEQFVPWDNERMTLTNSAGLLARYLAETVTGAMLALNGNFLPYLQQQQKSHWGHIGFTPIENKTLLIVGAGAIGQWVANNAKTLGMKVVGIRASGASHSHFDEMHTPDKLTERLGEADFVSLHVRHTPETTHLMNAAMFAAMKPGAFFINTARGAVVDENALCDALDCAHVAGAYLDVFETEPLPKDSPLWQKPNVLLTPHAADAVSDWPVRFADYFADNLQRWCDGEPLHNVVTPG